VACGRNAALSVARVAALTARPARAPAASGAQAYEEYPTFVPARAPAPQAYAQPPQQHYAPPPQQQQHYAQQQQYAQQPQYGQARPGHNTRQRVRSNAPCCASGSDALRLNPLFAQPQPQYGGYAPQPAAPAGYYGAPSARPAPTPRPAPPPPVHKPLPGAIVAPLLPNKAAAPLHSRAPPPPAPRSTVSEDEDGFTKSASQKKRERKAKRDATTPGKR